MANNTTMLDELFGALTRDPKNLLILALSIAGLCFSTPSVVIGMLLFMALRLFRAPLWLVVSIGGLGIVSALAAWLIGDINLHLLHEVNRYWWRALINDDK